MDTEYFALYPVYIDQNKTKAEGRKYSKSLAVKDPKYTEIKAALDKLHIPYKAEQSVKHPRCQWVPGRFSIKKQCKKVELIQQLIEKINTERLNSKSTNKQVPNLLNLVPRKKNKGNKNKK